MGAAVHRGCHRRQCIVRATAGGNGVHKSSKEGAITNDETAPFNFWPWLRKQTVSACFVIFVYMAAAVPSKVHEYQVALFQLNNV